MYFFSPQIFTNAWCDWFMTNYSTILTAIPLAIAAVLKLIAIFHPEITSNSLVDLVQSWFKKAPSAPVAPSV
jgi:hypothetical protein